jgi:tetratricopeptide (TPR) repeat protein
MRITAQLIRAKDGFHIWSNTYDRNSKDIFVIQQDIASNIAQSLDISLDPKALEQMRWAGTNNADAYIAFLKGRELDKESHRADEFIDLRTMEKAKAFYEESIKLDPNFVNAYLFHADFFLHYILKDDPRYQSSLTESQAYKMFMDDLGNTVSRSKDESQKDYYRIPQIMYSNDWTNFREVIEKSLNSPDAVKHYKYQNFHISSLLTGLGYGSQLAAISKNILKNDPSEFTANGEIILNLIYLGKYNEALQKISKMDVFSSQQDETVMLYKIYSLYQLGKMDEAYELISKMERSRTTAFDDLKAMVLAKKGRNREAKEIMKAPRRRSDTYLLAIDAVFGRQAANKEANLLDQKALLDFPLFRSYALSPNNSPFDLSVTPNFARRLKQAGIENQK